MAWQDILTDTLHLGLPDPRRVERAQGLVTTVTPEERGPDRVTLQVNFRHTITLERNPGTQLLTEARCSCQDYNTRQREQGLACKHLVALTLWLVRESREVWELFTTSATPGAAEDSAAIWPAQRIGRRVGAAIERLSERIGAFLMECESPLLIGPTGVGKTSAVHRVALTLDMGIEETVGSDSWTEADLIGTWTPAREWAWGPVGRAFQRARQGESVVLFVDEVTRFNPRAMDLLLRALQPLNARLARRMGVNVPQRTGEVFVTEAPLLGHRDWAPARNLTWIAAGNAGVNPLDPALVRRFQVLPVHLDRAVLEALPSPACELVGACWDSYEQGELPLPLEYQALTQAGDVTDLFQRYHARLQVLDPIAAEALVRVLEGHGVTLAAGQTVAQD